MTWWRGLAGIVVAAVGLPGAARVYEVLPVPEGGSLAGSVKFVGVPPRLEPLLVKKDREVT